MLTKGKINTDLMRKSLGSLRKKKPPMFNGEIEKVEEAEAWMSKMKKVFPNIQLL